VRSLALVLLIAGASRSAIGPPGGGDATARRLHAGAGVSLSVPRGWHLLRRVVAPGAGQAGVVASFRARFARRPCPCARPNYFNCGAWCSEPRIANFPLAGAIVFIWEFPRYQGRGYLRHRPARFSVGQEDPEFASKLARELRRLHREVGQACVEGPGSHPSWWSDFDDGRAFQLEVYLGPAAGRSVRARLDELLNSLEVNHQRDAGQTSSAAGPA
jgi:hypothetical protein